MRWLFLMVLGFPFALAGCESCEFSFGSLSVTGTITASKLNGLRVRTCTSPEADCCDEGTVTIDATNHATFTAWVPSEEVGLLGWSCEFRKHWLVISADGCATQEVDVAADMRSSWDLQLACTVP